MSVASQTVKDLLANGVHFGHQTNKWNPKMKKFIFGEKSGIYIIDLLKTEKALKEAADFLEDITSTGKTVLFVGTKKQAKKIIKEQAIRCEMYYVDERWLGGCLTNFATIRRSVDKLNQLQESKTSETYDSLAKKEKVRMEKAEAKLLKNLAGIRDMEKLPDAVIIVDAEDEHIAILEARKLGIPVVGLIDTNCDPDLIDYPIPGNDDAIRSVQYIITALADAVEKGRKKSEGVKKVKPEVVEKKEEAPKVEVEVKEAAPEEKEEADTEEPKAEEEVVDGDIKLNGSSQE